MILSMLTISKGNVFVTSCPLDNVCLRTVPPNTEVFLQRL